MPALLLISENGLYKLVIRSDKPDAPPISGLSDADSPAYAPQEGHLGAENTRS